MKTRPEKPAARTKDLQDAVLDEARDRAADQRAREEQQATDESFTPPHGDPERVHLDVETAVRSEQHSIGILSELDGGGVRFRKPVEEPADPVSPKAKPYGTTEDQVRNMENEGQAQQHATAEEPPPAVSEKPRRKRKA